MDRERLLGTAKSTLVMVALSAFWMGRDVLQDPALLLWMIPVWAAAMYYLWPRTITWLIALYQERGYTLAPSGLRIIQSALLAVAALLFGILMSRLTGRPLDWGGSGVDRDWDVRAGVPDETAPLGAGARAPRTSLAALTPRAEFLSSGTLVHRSACQASGPREGTKVTRGGLSRDRPRSQGTERNLNETLLPHGAVTKLVNSIGASLAI